MKPKYRLALITGFAFGLLLLSIVGIAPAQSALAALPSPPPPPPTAEPGYVASAAPPNGALIVLSYPIDQLPLHAWADVATLVQWQDNSGNWHAVDGWRGRFDSVNGDKAYKVWWLSSEHFGTGAFRWTIYSLADGAIYAVSAPFNLPSYPGETVHVMVP